MTPENWPAWRKRLLDWEADRGHDADAAYYAAYAFLRDQAGERGELHGALERDGYAWYLLGSAYLHSRDRGSGRSTDLAHAEQALRHSLRLDPRFAQAHRSLAVALLFQEIPGDPTSAAKGAEARQELEEARRLDPALELRPYEALAAARQRRYGEAERLYAAALRDDPKNADLARGAAKAVVSDPQRGGSHAQAVQRYLDQFPNDGVLVCMHGLALAEDQQPRAAVAELQRARGLGTDPAEVLPPQLIKDIEEAAAPAWWEIALWALGGFVGLYGAAMLLMAVAGAVLARWTRGDRALQLLGAPPEELVTAGQVLRSRHESWLARVYALALFLGLILFYLAIPFLVAAMVAGTGLLIYLIFLLGRIPLKLVVIIVLVGLGGAWAIFKSIFARPGRGAFGIPKTAEQCPRLYEALADVARRVDTDPVDAVYLAPGSSISVHQEGRGPFGVLGAKKRVLTLGLSTLPFLTAAELKSILAHEYAHFSHRDTFYSRFIYQVTLTIHEALNGMARAGGGYNYVNPVYWFLVLYYKAYSLLAAGYSRSREFLADRMAAGLYGSDVFTSALTKVCTDGTLFDMTMYNQVSRLLAENKAFTNLYAAFRDIRDQHIQPAEREELYKKLLEEKESLFASHPTFGERVAAVAPLPKAERPDTAPATTLFENVEEVEKELTEFLTGYVSHIRRMQAAAAAR